MKNKVVLLLMIISLLTFMLLSTSCARDENIIEDQDIVKKVIELEKNEYLLKTVQISYNEYLKNVEPLIFSNSNFLDRYNKEELWVKVKNVYNSKTIQKSDILNASDEQLKKLRDKLVPPERSIPTEETMKFEPLNISKIYYDEIMKGKAVFVTQLEDGYLKGTDVMDYRRYIFKKDNKEWKVFDIRATVVVNYDSPEFSMHLGGTNSIFEELNGEKVIYDTLINVDQYDKK